MPRTADAPARERRAQLICQLDSDVIVGQLAVGAVLLTGAAPPVVGVAVGPGDAASLSEDDYLWAFKRVRTAVAVP